MSQSAVNSLLEALRRSSFSSGAVRVDGVRLEFGQIPPVSVAPAAPAVPERPPAPETVVRTGGPGIVELQVGVGDTVEEGAQLGQVRVHRKTMPLVAPVGGRVTSVLLPDGAFAGYGEVVCSIRPDR